jgi:secreted trypsin-like serine protease
MSAAVMSGCVAPTDETSAADDSEIIGGVNDTGDNAVFALFASQPGARNGSLCTATLIAPKVLLHAAHCVDPREIGSGNVFVAIQGSSLSDRNQKRFQIVKTAFDTKFNPNRLQDGHDVGVSFLAAAPPNTTPIAFNKVAMSQALVGKPVRLVGFGVNVQGSNPSGAGVKRQVTTVLDSIDPARNGQLLQIGKFDKQTCNGDSGGPAFMKLDPKSNVETIVGVTSFGAAGCVGNGGFDTRVDTQLAFINAALAAPEAK